MRLVLLAVLAFGLPIRAEAEMYRGTETPQYSVVREVGSSELRDYGPTLVAEVTARGSRSGAANAGFRVLAGYIFGDNATGQKIAMTTPVTQVPAATEGQDSGVWTVRFTLPAGLDLGQLPDPGNAQIRFVQTPARQMLVRAFPGVPTAEAIDTARKAVLADAKAAGLEITGPPEFLFYDPPWRMPWNRRNEIALVVN